MTLALLTVPSLTDPDRTVDVPVTVVGYSGGYVECRWGDAIVWAPPTSLIVLDSRGEPVRVLGLAPEVK